MTAATLKELTDRYIEKANFHGVEAVLGDKKYRKWHQFQERMHDRLMLEVIEVYLNAHE